LLENNWQILEINSPDSYFPLPKYWKKAANRRLFLKYFTKNFYIFLPIFCFFPYLSDFPNFLALFFQ